MKFHLSFLPPLAAALALSSIAVAATAGKEEKTKSLENQARAACLLGDYQKGTEILVRLFIQTNRAVYLFNQGRCYQQNHRWEQAIDRFREFLRKVPDLEDSLKAQVKAHIAECESILTNAGGGQAQQQGRASASKTATPEDAGQNKAVAETRALPADVSSVPYVPSPEPSAKSADLTQVAPEPSHTPSETSIFSRWWFWAAVGVAAAGGITVGLLLSRSSGTKPFSCPDCESISGVNAP